MVFESPDEWLDSILDFYPYGPSEMELESGYRWLKKFEDSLY